MNKCLLCGISSENNKYCSSKCFHDTQKGKKRSEFSKKISLLMLEKKESYKGTPRAKNISLARSQRSFTEEEWGLLKEVIEKCPWIIRPDLIVKESGVEHLFGRVKKERLSDVKKLRDTIRGECVYFFELPIQKWSREKMESFKKDCDRIFFLPPDYFQDVFGVKERGKTFYKIIKMWGMEGSYFSRSITWIERFIQDFLKKSGVSYRREVVVGNYRVDFLIRNKIIETNGTYWHSDPRVYPRESLNSLQVKNLTRDRDRLTYLKERGYTVLEVWEKDIKENPDFVRKMVSDFIGEKE